MTGRTLAEAHTWDKRSEGTLRAKKNPIGRNL